MTDRRATRFPYVPSEIARASRIARRIRNRVRTLDQPSERVLDRIRRQPFLRLHPMLVGVHRERRAEVPQRIAGDFRVNASAQKHRRERVPQIVKPGPKPQPCGQFREPVRQPVRMRCGRPSTDRRACR
jgi:hypothetical protein